MWNPDQETNENQGLTIPSKDELFQALEQSEHAREYYGLEKLPNGVMRVRELEKVKLFPEEVKAMLREFLKNHSLPLTMPVNHPAGMSERTRRELDDLYRKLNRLAASDISRKYFKKDGAA